MKYKILKLNLKTKIIIQHSVDIFEWMNVWIQRHAKIAKTLEENIQINNSSTS